MIPRLDARTRLIALLGDPVDHSLSPVFQNAAMRAAGVRGIYLALRCDRESFPALLRGIASAGGAGNVTVPHKEAAAAAVDRATEEVRRTGACNTFWFEAGAVHGDNTDVVGFREAARDLLGAPPTGARVLLLGAGGAARAVVAALQDDGVGEILLVNRTPGRARALLQHFDGTGARLSALEGSDALAGEHFDLVVNATSLGLREGDPLPLDADADVRFDAAIDLAYTPGGTRWIRELRERGVRAQDGREMLIRQGAASFHRWWGRPAPLEAMRASLDLPG